MSASPWVVSGSSRAGLATLAGQPAAVTADVAVLVAAALIVPLLLVVTKVHRLRPARLQSSTRRPT
jgi:hypothetical protein